MSSEMAAMTKNDVFNLGIEFLELAHKWGFAVVIFTPNEVEGVNVTHLEDYMITKANDFIEYNKE